MIWQWANEYLKDIDKGRTCCWKTESKENKSNSASYERFPEWF
jgi:6-pyruvoyltetrahydropterin/6-carboxytetrahydropterin synthase